MKSAFGGRSMSKPERIQPKNRCATSALLCAETANARYIDATRPITDCQANFSFALMPFGSRRTTFR